MKQWFLDIKAGRNRKAIYRAHRLLARQRAVAHRLPIGHELAEPTEALDLSIVTFNNGQWIEGFIASLLHQDYPLELLRLIVIDNSSTDDTLALWNKAREQHAEHLRGFDIYSRPNTGYGSAHNFALQKSSAAFFMVANVDLEFTPQALTTVMSLALADAEDIASWELRQQPFEHPHYYDPVTLETICSVHACVLFRRSLLRKAGGYEPRIFLYGEDIELSYRLIAAGYRLRYCPCACVVHHSYRQAHEFKPRQYLNNNLNNCLIRIRHGSGFDRLAIFFRLLSIRHGSRHISPDGAFFRSILKGLIRNWPHFLPHKSGRRGIFPLNGVNYELHREGSFYRLPEETTPAPVTLLVFVEFPVTEPWLRELLVTIRNQTLPPAQLLMAGADGAELQAVLEGFRDWLPVPAMAFSAESLHDFLVWGPQKARTDLIGFATDGCIFFANHLEVLGTELTADPDAAVAFSRGWIATAAGDRQSGSTYETRLAAAPFTATPSGVQDLPLTLNHPFMIRRSVCNHHQGETEHPLPAWQYLAVPGQTRVIDKTTFILRNPA